MELPVASLSVADPFHFEFVRVVDSGRLSFSWRLVGGWRFIAVEQQNLEHIVLPDHIHKVYIVSILIDDLSYCALSCPYGIQLLRWPCSTDMGSWNSDLISNLDNNFSATSIQCLTCLSLLQVLTESLVGLLHASCKGVCLVSRFQARWLLPGLKLHRRRVVVIRLEWSHTRRRVYHVIVREFG